MVMKKKTISLGAKVTLYENSSREGVVFSHEFSSSLSQPPVSPDTLPSDMSFACSMVQGELE